MRINRKYLILFTAALMLRVVYIFVPAFDYYSKSYPVSFSASEQVSDSETYVKLAKGVLDKGYPSINGRLTMYGGFLYPFILAIFLRISENLIPLILIQAVLSSLVCILIAKISNKLFASEIPGLIGGYIWALYYPAYMTVSRPLTEPVFTFLIIWGIYLVLNDKKGRRGYTVYIYSGIVFSAATLTRAMLFYVFLLMVIVYFLYFLFKEKKAEYKILFTVLFFLLIQIPWVYAGYVHNGRIILGSTNGGGNLVLGTYIPGNGEYSKEIFERDPNHPIHYFDKLYVENNWTDAQRDSAYLEFGKKQLKENFSNMPFESLRLMFYQILRFWYNVPYSHKSGIGNDMNIAVTFLLMIFAVYGFAKGRILNSGASIFLILFLIIFCLPHAFTTATVRYSFPILPVMFVFSGYGIYAAASKLLRKRTNAN